MAVTIKNTVMNLPI